MAPRRRHAWAALAFVLLFCSDSGRQGNDLCVRVMVVWAVAVVVLYSAGLLSAPDPPPLFFIAARTPELV